MTEYADVSKANTLIEEQTRIADAIQILDDGGTVVTFTVAPAPLPPPVEGQPPPSLPPKMPITIQTIDPAQALLDQARVAMVVRHDAITTELEGMGVTGSPPARSIPRS
jgi:hypothetical protein